MSGLVFSPLSAIMASCSWDKTCKLWDVFERKGNIETLQLNADGELRSNDLYCIT